ncbi:MAG: 5-oxoprolinase subunit PxpA [Alphaproteobacteria bacterium]
MLIDLNADAGEGFGPWRLGDDAALVRTLSSVNVACGFHAGDAEIMAATVAHAQAAGCEVGAHVGFPDLIGFGRRRMAIDGPAFANHVVYQLGALAAIAAVAGHRVTHLSFHGALGDMAAEDEGLARVLVGAVAAFDRDLVISTSPGTMTMRAARARGMRTVGIFAADRAYRPDGRLVSRAEPGAVIRDPAAVAARVLRLLDGGTVAAADGSAVAMPARTVMIHSDTADAAAIATRIRRAVEAAGGSIVPMSRLPSDA